MRDLESLFIALERSRFRSRFRLGSKDADYLGRKWHGIEAGEPLTAEQVDYIVRVIGRWLERASLGP